jgi:hypothetical protein
LKRAADGRVQRISLMFHDIFVIRFGVKQIRFPLASIPRHLPLHPDLHHRPARLKPPERGLQPLLCDPGPPKC